MEDQREKEKADETSPDEKQEKNSSLDDLLGTYTTSINWRSRLYGWNQTDKREGSRFGASSFHPAAG